MRERNHYSEIANQKKAPLLIPWFFIVSMVHLKGHLAWLFRDWGILKRCGFDSKNSQNNRKMVNLIPTACKTCQNFSCLFLSPTTISIKILMENSKDNAKTVSPRYAVFTECLIIQVHLGTHKSKCSGRKQGFTNSRTCTYNKRRSTV